MQETITTMSFLRIIALAIVLVSISAQDYHYSRALEYRPASSHLANELTEAQRGYRQPGASMNRWWVQTHRPRTHQSTNTSVRSRNSQRGHNSYSRHYPKYTSGQIRFSGGRPIWSLGPQFQKATTVRSVSPTRLPPSGANSSPPLVHKPTDPQGAKEGWAPKPKPDDNSCVITIISYCPSSNESPLKCLEKKGSASSWNSVKCDDNVQAAISEALKHHGKP